MCKFQVFGTFSSNFNLGGGGGGSFYPIHESNVHKKAHEE